MGATKKPRKPYSGRQNRAAERLRQIRQYGTPADSSILLSVTPDAAGHPVARDIERGQIVRAGDDLEALVLLAAEGAHLPQVMDDCIQMLALAMFASRDYDLPEETQVQFLAAVDALTLMGNGGCYWRTQYSALIAEAVATAAPMLAALPPAERNRAAFELRGIDALATMGAAREAAERMVA